MMIDDTDRTSSSPSTDAKAPDAAAKAADTMGRLSDTASDTLAATREQATKLGADLQAQASEIGAEAKERAQGFLDEQKGTGADQVEGIARAVGRAADELEQSAPQLAGYVREAASAAQNLSTSLRDRSSGELMQDVGDFARRSPAAFFGSAVVVGLALSRFLKSSGEQGTGPATGRTTEPAGPSASGTSHPPASSNAPTAYRRYGGEDSTAVASQALPGRGRTNP